MAEVITAEFSGPSLQSIMIMITKGKATNMLTFPVPPEVLRLMQVIRLKQAKEAGMKNEMRMKKREREEISVDDEGSVEVVEMQSFSAAPVIEEKK